MTNYRYTHSQGQWQPIILLSSSTVCVSECLRRVRLGLGSQRRSSICQRIRANSKTNCASLQLEERNYNKAGRSVQPDVLDLVRACNSTVQTRVHESRCHEARGSRYVGLSRPWIKEVAQRGTIIPGKSQCKRSRTECLIEALEGWSI